jgi:hypothetical protein
MISQFFRTGRTRGSNASPIPVVRTHDGKWFGDCNVCRCTFVYQEKIFIDAINKPKGGFCYRCRKEYCSMHVNWEKSNIRKPDSNEIYDGFNALCPQCGILLNYHFPELEAIDAELKIDLSKGLDHLTSLLNLLREREFAIAEIERLEDIRLILLQKR